jgi:CubicO group peptidase (beta-lactamase class C family)
MPLMRPLPFLRNPLLLAFIGLICVSFLAANSAAQRDRQSGPSSAALRLAISAAAKKYNVPGIAAALIESGQLRAVETFGVRDLKSGASITANTIFEAGSLGEPLYAYSVLLLSADGRFNPGAPLPSYEPLPYVRFLDPMSPSPATEPIDDPFLNQVTALRVMNHTSGMPGWARNQHLQLALAPGRKWLYSNEGYLYLQHVVEHVTGEAFDSFVAHNVLAPAGMAHSNFTWRDAFAGELATGYDRTGAPVESHRYLRPAATATLYTSIRDYAQFVTHILASAPALRAHESAVSLMLNPTVAVDDAVPFSWGLGIGLEKVGDDLFFFHRENSPGFQSLVIASRKTGRGVVILTNSGNGLDAAAEIVAATLTGNHPVLNSNFVRAK